MKSPRFVAAVAAVVVCSAPLLSRPSLEQRRNLIAGPSVMLWAWERPEDLRFIKTDDVGVAFLAGTIHLGKTAKSSPRMQPLRISLKTKLVAVVRIETSRTARLDQHQVEDCLRYLAEVSTLPRVSMVQIDFDATVSERKFYRQLLVKLRQQLPSSTPISITALASWCIGDQWIADLPIDEAVPMLFRMGTGQSEVKNWIVSARDFPAA